MLKEIFKYGEAEIVYKEKKLLSEHPKLTNLFWETTLRCNAFCKHCGSRAGENINIEEELTTDEIKNVLKSIADKYNTESIFLNITGGEPLVRKDLFEVMEYASKLGYKWGMVTNGILIDDNIIQKMKDTNLSNISISLDGLENTHDNFRGTKGSYSKIIENIKKLKKANFIKIFQITTVANKTNIRELEEMYKIISELNIDSWRILNIDPMGRAQDNLDLALDNEDYKYLINFIKEKRKKTKYEITYGCGHFLGIKYEKETRPNCFMCYAGITIGSILNNGDIFVCPNVERRQELIQGNVRQDDFVEVWENKFKWFRDLNKFKCKECENCEDWKYCMGDSTHSWDFENKKPKICLNKILNN